MKATRDCAVVDMTVGIRRMEASTTQIRRGDTDDIEWHLLFESAEPTKRLSEIDVEVALPYGEYISYRMLSGSGWILHVECDGTPFELVIEEPGDDPAEYQYSSNHGAWDLDEDGRFINGAPGEILGGFEIRPGIVTNAVWQNNLTRMVWFDNDDSGTWSEGDNFEFVLDEGVIYMAEMVVTYERDGEILPPDDEEPVPELYVDAATGLMWENDHQAILRPYADALAYCQDLDLAGHADWRVPTVDELRTLIVGCADTVTGGACACGDDATDYAECMGSCEGCWAWEGPADGCYWPADLAGICHRHWTSTAAHVDWDPDGSYVFGIGFLQGAIDVYNTGTEGRFSFVRCVRD